MKVLHNIDKSTWGDGPWQTEPDDAQWTEEKSGLACRIIRTRHSGSLCGYVGIPLENCWHGKGYDEIPEVIQSHTHGGLTFADYYDHDDSNLWWLGFDCAHCDDFSPYHTVTLKKIMGDSYMSWHGEIYRDFEYVKSRVEDLAVALNNFNQEEKENQA